MGSSCHKNSNPNKIFTNTENPIPLSNQASSESLPKKPIIKLQKVASDPMHQKLFKEQNLIKEEATNKNKEPISLSKPKDEIQPNNSRIPFSGNSNEKPKTFLTNKK